MNIGKTEATNYLNKQSYLPSNYSTLKTNTGIQSKEDIFIPSNSNSNFNKVSTINSMMQKAPENVLNAWEEAEEETGFNPLLDKEGKIVGSALLVRMMEMEYSLGQDYGVRTVNQQLQMFMSSAGAARSLISSALERATNPLTGSSDSSQVAQEKAFYQSFLKNLD